MAAIVCKTKLPSVDRDPLTERERTARGRRAVKRGQMTDTLNALECATLVLLTLGDEDAVWEDFLDDDGKRMRRHLTRTLQLTNQAQLIQRENGQLQRLLREHELSMRVLAGMINTYRETNDWDWRVDQLHEIASRSFKPWTKHDAVDDMGIALEQFHAFQWSADKETSGLTFLGWREFRRVDSVRGQFHFQFDKTFRGYDIMDYVKVGWDAYTDSTMFLKVIFGTPVNGSHEVLQWIDDDTVIVRVAQRFPHLKVDVHVVYLVFRVPTERGVTQCVRSILCPELQKAINSSSDMWTSASLWFNWERLEADEQGYVFKMGESVGRRT